jgi:hypothetical protein
VPMRKLGRPKKRKVGEDEHQPVKISNSTSPTVKPLTQPHTALAPIHTSRKLLFFFFFF